MTSILPHQRPAIDTPAVLGVGGTDLSDLTAEELASVIAAASAAVDEALLRIWERKDQEAAEERTVQHAASAAPMWPAPAPLGPETFAERLRLRLLAVASVGAGLAAYCAAIGVWS